LIFWSYSDEGVWHSRYHTILAQIAEGLSRKCYLFYFLDVDLK